MAGHVVGLSHPRHHSRAATTTTGHVKEIIASSRLWKEGCPVPHTDAILFRGRSACSPAFRAVALRCCASLPGGRAPAGRDCRMQGWLHRNGTAAWTSEPRCTGRMTDPCELGAQRWLVLRSRCTVAVSG